jgi:hypothetical protein
LNAFNKVLAAEASAATRLGNPSENSAAFHRRMNAMATMTGTHGFPVPPLEPRKDAQGKTRGQRKRAARAKAMAKVGEVRAPQFMHSHARRTLESA